MIFPLKWPSVSCAFRVDHFILNEPQLSMCNILHPSFPCVVRPPLGSQHQQTHFDRITLHAKALYTDP